jgi:hypothetical protein
VTKNLPDGVGELVKERANVVLKRYHKWVERDDLVQEGLAWCVARTQQVNDAFNEPDDEQRKHNLKRIGWQILRACERYARREKAHRSGYLTGDEYFYETSTIAQMMPHILRNIFDGVLLEQAQQLVDDGMPRRSSAPAEGRNLLAMLIDIKRGYEILEHQDRKEETNHCDYIKARYYDELKLQQIAEMFGCSVSTADRRCENALKALQRVIGGDNPWS